MDSSTHKFKANQELWNQKTSVHKDSDFYKNEDFLAGACSLNEEEILALGNVTGKHLLHLQCHFGQDTLSFARRGAQVTGVDLSDQSIDLAKEQAQKIGIDADFICCNVLNTRQHIKSQFDIVFTSYGTIGWLPDLEPWAKVVADSLKPGGSFVIIDFHPMIWSLNDQFEQLGYPYFNRDTIEEDNEGTYADKTAEIGGKSYSWNHSFGELFNSLKSEGLELETFNEYDYSNYNCFPNLEQFRSGKWRFPQHEDRIPYMYLQKWVKPL
ncbi:MAG: SAM-dependent methyltransferase [Litorivivens sp.]|jgi:SAM-dependent methyltransferase